MFLLNSLYSIRPQYLMPVLRRPQTHQCIPPLEKSSYLISIGFAAGTRINREDYGLPRNMVFFESGGVVVRKKIRIFLNIEADLRNEQHKLITY